VAWANGEYWSDQFYNWNEEKINELDTGIDSPILSSNDEKPEISVLISTLKNQALPYILETMNSLSQQHDSNVELIIVVDENVELFNKLEKYKKFFNNICIKIIFNKTNCGLSYSRNLGIQNSSSDIIAFIDDDAVPKGRWVSSIIDSFKDPNVGGVAGEVVPDFESQDSLTWFPRALYWMISCSYTMTPTKRTEIDRGFGVNMAFRRHLLQKVGMFNTSLGLKKGKWIGGEDTDVFMKIRKNNCKIIFNPDAIVHHKIPKKRMNPVNIVRRAFNGGISSAAFSKINDISMIDSKEYSYLKHLMTSYFPSSLIQLIKCPSRNVLRSISYVSVVIFFEMVGYGVGIFHGYKPSL